MLHHDTDHVLLVIIRTYLATPDSNWERQAAQWAFGGSAPEFCVAGICRRLRSADTPHAYQAMRPAWTARNRSACGVGRASCAGCISTSVWLYARNNSPSSAPRCRRATSWRTWVAVEVGSAQKRGCRGARTYSVASNDRIGIDFREPGCEGSRWEEPEFNAFHISVTGDFKRSARHSEFAHENIGYLAVASRNLKHRQRRARSTGQAPSGEAAS